MITCSGRPERYCTLLSGVKNLRWLRTSSVLLNLQPKRCPRSLANRVRPPTQVAIDSSNCRPDVYGRRINRELGVSQVVVQQISSRSRRASSDSSSRSRPDRVRSTRNSQIFRSLQPGIVERRERDACWKFDRDSPGRGQGEFQRWDLHRSDLIDLLLRVCAWLAMNVGSVRCGFPARS